MTGAAREPLRLFAVFHLNLAYSAIEEEQRAEVVRRCYRPLLEAAAEHALPVGVNLSGYTLEAAAAADPAWVDALRAALAAGRCELIGCGWAQLIGPLVPAAVNAANLRLGNLACERLLGRRPEIALVNEQAYAAGLVRHYLDAGYRAIVCDWDNPARTHPEWPAEWRYLPQRARGPAGEAIPVIWNKSIAFQKFQRYAQGEMDLDEYLAYVLSHVGVAPRAFPLYGNDAEVLDFRPGRYGTEVAVHPDGEWRRIDRLLAALARDERVRFVRPGEVLDLLAEPGAGNVLRLESAEQPVPVKKQGKYNVTRWAVTGRDDLAINTACWRIASALERRGDAGDDDWRELCTLWSSDYRTHITARRWAAYRTRLAAAERRLAAGGGSRPAPSPAPTAAAPTVSREGNVVAIDTGGVRLRLSTRRGLAVESLAFPAVSEQPLCGTLRHGFFDDIAWGADFFTGHLVLESAGRPKLTDLEPVEPAIEHDGDAGEVRIAGRVATPLGAVEKTVAVSLAEARVTITFRLLWERIPAGALRLGHVTLLPAAFDEATLHYATCNGGRDTERFPLAGRTVDHGAAVSFLVSASHGHRHDRGVGGARRRPNDIARHRRHEHGGARRHDHPPPRGAGVLHPAVAFRRRGRRDPVGRRVAGTAHLLDHARRPPP